MGDRYCEGRAAPQVRNGPAPRQSTFSRDPRRAGNGRCLVGRRLPRRERRTATRSSVRDAAPERLDRALARIFPMSRARACRILSAAATCAGDGPVSFDPSVKVGAGARAQRRGARGIGAGAGGRTPRPRDRLRGRRPHRDRQAGGPRGAPAPGHDSGTLVNGLIAHCGGQSLGHRRGAPAGIVHRLDKDTSGLLVVAKNDLAHAGLTAQFADHGRSGPLERAYQALVWGVPEPRLGTSRRIWPAAPQPREDRGGARGRGRHAVTHYRVEEAFGTEGTVARVAWSSRRDARTRSACISAIAVTRSGRRGLWRRLPDQGEPAGAGRARGLETLGRQALHAGLLGFAHPRSGETLRFESPLPREMQNLIAALKAGT